MRRPSCLLSPHPAQLICRLSPLAASRLAPLLLPETEKLRRLTGDYDFSNADKFLNLASTRKALGVGEREWEGCSPWIYEVRHAPAEDATAAWRRVFFKTCIKCIGWEWMS